MTKELTQNTPVKFDDDLNDYLNDYLGQYLSKDQNGNDTYTLPGVGYEKNMTLSNWVLTEDGKKVKSLIQGLKNDLLKV